MSIKFGTEIGEPILCANENEKGNKATDKMTLLSRTGFSYKDDTVVPVLEMIMTEDTTDPGKARMWLTAATARDLITSLTYWVTEVERAEEK